MTQSIARVIASGCGALILIAFAAAAPANALPYCRTAHLFCFATGQAGGACSCADKSGAAESGVIVDAPAENARPSGSRLPEATYDKGGIPAARFIDAPPPRASGALRFLTVIQSGDSPARQPRVQRCGDAAIRFYYGKKCGFVWAVQ